MPWHTLCSRPMAQAMAHPLAAWASPAPRVLVPASTCRAVRPCRVLEGYLFVSLLLSCLSLFPGTGERLLCQCRIPGSTLKLLFLPSCLTCLLSWSFWGHNKRCADLGAPACNEPVLKPHFKLLCCGSYAWGLMLWLQASLESIGCDCGHRESTKHVHGHAPVWAVLSAHGGLSSLHICMGMHL